MGYKCYFYTGASHTPTNLGEGGVVSFKFQTRHWLLGGFFFGGGGL